MAGIVRNVGESIGTAIVLDVGKEFLGNSQVVGTVTKPIENATATATTAIDTTVGNFGRLITGKPRVPYGQGYVPQANQPTPQHYSTPQPQPQYYSSPTPQSQYYSTPPSPPQSSKIIILPYPVQGFGQSFTLPPATNPTPEMGYVPSL